MKEESLGFVGLGAIGLPIAKNLLAAGYNLRVHTRSRTAEKDPGLKGANACSSPRDAAKGCEVFFICVSDDDAVEDVLFGSKGASQSLDKGSLIIDLSTISPSSARSNERTLAKKHIQYIDAPVTGGTEGAINGDLAIFLGCSKQTLGKINPLIKSIATHIYTFGEVGKGQEVKAINQILVAGSYAAVAEAIALGQTLELPMNIVIDALSKGAASSWALANRSKAMLEDQYPLGFKLGLHYKDLLIALKTAEELGLTLEVTKKVKDIEKKLIHNGFSDYDVSVLRRSVAK